MNDDDDGLVTLEIKIARVINADGEMTWSMTTPEQFSAIEVLGLLTVGQWQVFHEMSKRHGE